LLDDDNGAKAVMLNTMSLSHSFCELPLAKKFVSACIPFCVYAVTKKKLLSGFYHTWQFLCGTFIIMLYA